MPHKTLHYKHAVKIILPAIIVICAVACKGHNSNNLSVQNLRQFFADSLAADTDIVDSFKVISLDTLTAMKIYRSFKIGFTDNLSHIEKRLLEVVAELKDDATNPEATPSRKHVDTLDYINLNAKDIYLKDDIKNLDSLIKTADSTAIVGYSAYCYYVMKQPSPQHYIVILLDKDLHFFTGNGTVAFIPNFVSKASQYENGELPPPMP